MGKIEAVRFHNDVVLKKVAGTRGVFVLKEPLQVSFRRQFRTEWETVRIEEGFLTDGASVPRPLWWFAPPFADTYLPAAVLHDAMYATHAVDKNTADWLFLRGMLTLGVNGTKARLMYHAVRLFGGRPWAAGGKASGVVTFVRNEQ